LSAYIHGPFATQDERDAAWTTIHQNKGEAACMCPTCLATPPERRPVQLPANPIKLRKSDGSYWIGQRAAWRGQGGRGRFDK
jgi:hypothetical protein